MIGVKYAIAVFVSLHKPCHIKRKVGMREKTKMIMFFPSLLVFCLCLQMLVCDSELLTGNLSVSLVFPSRVEQGVDHHVHSLQQYPRIMMMMALTIEHMPLMLSVIFFAAEEKNET